LRHSHFSFGPPFSKKNTSQLNKKWRRSREGTKMSHFYYA
jgi:hypothetical protein